MLLTQTVSVEQPISLEDKLASLIEENLYLDRNELVHPALVVNTPFGKRGVWYAIDAEAGPSIGVCRITKEGFCHRPNNLDGCHFYHPNELLAHDQN